MILVPWRSKANNLYNSGRMSFLPFRPSYLNASSMKDHDESLPVLQRIDLSNIKLRPYRSLWNLPYVEDFSGKWI